VRIRAREAARHSRCVWSSIRVGRNGDWGLAVLREMKAQRDVPRALPIPPKTFNALDTGYARAQVGWNPICPEADPASDLVSGRCRPGSTSPARKPVPAAKT
jgi:hypothetical protein